MKQPKREQMSVPRIHKDVKAMNGKSTEKLRQCIEDLSELLDENDEAQNEKMVDGPDTLHDAQPE
jgi:hypothetical protein